MSVSRETGLLTRNETDAELIRLLGQLDSLLARLDEAESQWSRWLDAVAPEYRPSARNVAHYWAIRQLDLREFQHRLAAFGLSSLGRSEPHVEAALRLVRSAVQAMLDDGWCPPANAAVGAEEGRELLAGRTVELLGPVPAERGTRIMVTLPPEAATDPGLVLRLVECGMDVARINCAHDGPAAVAGDGGARAGRRSPRHPATAWSRWISRARSCAPGRSSPGLASSRSDRVAMRSATCSRPPGCG